MPPITFSLASLVAQMVNAGDLCSLSGSGRSPGGGNGNPLQYFGLENSHGQRSLEGYSPWGCKESDMTEVTKYTQLFLCPEFLVSFPRNDTAPVLLLIVSMLFIRHCVGHISEVVKHHFFKSGKEKPPITSLLMSGFIHQG